MKNYLNTNLLVIILSFGYDEDEEYWEGETQNLDVYLRKMVGMNKDIKEYYETLGK